MEFADEAEDDGEEEEEEAAEVEGEIDLLQEGMVAPGQSVTLIATNDGSPVTNATVAVNGETVATTGDNGIATMAMPAGDELELEVTADDLEGELSIDCEEAEELEDETDDADVEDDESDAVRDGIDEHDTETDTDVEAEVDVEARADAETAADAEAAAPASADAGVGIELSLEIASPFSFSASRVPAGGPRSGPLYAVVRTTTGSSISIGPDNLKRAQSWEDLEQSTRTSGRSSSSGS